MKKKRLKEKCINFYNKMSIQKRGLSNIIVVVLMIIVVLVVILVVWNVIGTLLEKQTEISEIRAYLLTENMGIKNVDFVSSTKVNITITKGPSKLILMNVTIVKRYGDIVFLVDSTGSMGSEIQDVKNTITSFATQLEEADVAFRLALIEFKDYPEYDCGRLTDFPSKIHSFSSGDFTSDVSEYLVVLNTLVAAGGFDAPESHLTALDVAFTLDYLQEEGLQKYAILLSDNKPHAKDCEVGTSNTFVSCYHGPEYVQSVTDQLVDEDFIFYYINKDDSEGICFNRIMADGMTSATNGKFYSYTEAQGIGGIVMEISDTIVKNYEEAEKHDHLKVIFYYGVGESYTHKIYDTPAPLETREYEIDLENTEVHDITRIEIYPVKVTSDGQEIIGPALDVWNV